MEIPRAPAPGGRRSDDCSTDRRSRASLVLPIVRLDALLWAGRSLTQGGDLQGHHKPGLPADEAGARISRESLFQAPWDATRRRMAHTDGCASRTILVTERRKANRLQRLPDLVCRGVRRKPNSGRAPSQCDIPQDCINPGRSLMKVG
jgi:hypothetical protein